MLGSVSDAEDVVQEAFLRWIDADHSPVREPEAYLRRVATRLCLDQLKSARRRHETYVGPWLPDPLLEASENDVDDITLPPMLALERLSPLGDMQRLGQMLAADVVPYADGGGKIPATTEPIVGLEDVMELLGAAYLSGASFCREEVAARTLRPDQRPAGIRLD